MYFVYNRPRFSGWPSICFSILEAVRSFTGFIWSIGSPVWGQEQAIGSNLGPAGQLIGKNLGSTGPAGQLIGKNLGSAGPKSVNREEFRVCCWAQGAVSAHRRPRP